MIGHSAVSFAQYKTFLIDANSRADDFLWDCQEAFIKFTHQGNGPFNEASNLFKERWILNKL